MDWTFNRAGQWEGVDGAWNALIARLVGQVTWSAMLYLARLPKHRHEQHGFADVEAAKVWCEAEIKRLSEEARR